VLKGVLLKQPYPRSVFATSNLKKPFIDILSFNGSIISKNSSVNPVNGVNETRNTDFLVLFNKYFGTTTQTNQWGTEIIAQYLSANQAVNDTIYLIVTAKDSIMATGHGNNNIPGNGVVFSGHGTSATFLNDNVFVGDTIAYVLNMPPVEEKIKELIGGMPRLIRDSVATVEWQEEGTSYSFAHDRHPRTAVGFSNDSTKIYFITVDGRQPDFSVGMTLFELADYMLEWGIHEGVNFDGGGSTTMVVRGSVVNSPSDAGGERAVANAIMVVSAAPTGPIAIISIKPEEPYVIIGGQVQFSADAFDQYYNPITSGVDSLLFWSCDPAIGTINSQTGLFTSDTVLVSGYVYAEYNGVRDSVMVNVTDIASIELQPNPVILEVGEQQQMIAEAKDFYNNVINLSSDDYIWDVTDSIGTITQNGNFVATQTGSGFITASYNNTSGAAAISVGVSNDVIVDDFRVLSNWSLTGLRVNLASCSLSLDSTIVLSSPSSGKLDYSLTTGGTSALYMECSIPISGSPEAVGIYVYGDGKGHWLRSEFQDVDGEKFLLNFTESVPGINWTNSWQYLEKSFDDAIVHWGNPNAILTFPVTWNRIYLAETDENKKDSGTIYFDDFKVRFISSSIEDNTEEPISFQLQQNYPNPFNPETTINYSIPHSSDVNLTVFDIQGKLVDIIVNKNQSRGNYSVRWKTNDVASGLYIYRLKTANNIKTRKMIVMR
ncbi:phosphodiester glycosidase family protein, partial [Calditrichota bacterium]